MDANPLHVSLETLIATSCMLGHKLEDRSRISQNQDPALVRAFQAASTIPLSNSGQRDLFLVAPLDVLVTDCDGEKRFHIIETNGTGIGGLTNMPGDVVETILTGLREYAGGLPEPDALVLVALSGLESSKHPRRNHLLHEKLLYIEAIKRGMATHGGKARVLTMARLAEDPAAIEGEHPVIVLGYMKEFLNHLGCRADGRLTLYGRRVSAAVNDRFCLNVVSRFGHQVDMAHFRTLNRCFAAGADKGIAYGLLQEYALAHPGANFPRKIEFDRADSRAALIDGVVRWLRKGRRLVIKPQGTGLGHGLEFFLHPDEPPDAIIDKIDHSIRVTEHYYGAIGGAFPYTLCRFIDSCTIADSNHSLHGHKYELRIVVYRDESSLKAVPSITKISSQGYDADKATRLSLINNITTSAEAKHRDGTEFMLPLSNHETLALLGIKGEEMKALCAYCTGYMRYILDQVQKQPARFGLEATSKNALRTE